MSMNMDNKPKLVRKLNIGIIKSVFNKSLIIVYADNTFCQMTGYTQKELVSLAKRGISIAYSDDIQNVENAIQSNEYDDIECRFITKDGGFIWVLLNAYYQNEAAVFDGITVPVIQFTAVDITKYKNAILEIEDKKEVYRNIFEITEDIIFQYDIKSGFIEFTNNENVNEIKNLKSCTRREFFLSDIIFEEDKEKFLSSFKSIKNNKIKGIFEIRLKINDSDYEWYSVFYKVIFDRFGKPWRIVGKMSNINDEKNEKSRLIEKAQFDALTKLYNRATIESRIKEYLEEDSNSLNALMIVDVDKFKDINDTYGHLLGDAVLKDIAYKLKNVFRGTDIVGRIGGDEFLVFMRKINSTSTVFERAEYLCSEIRNIYDNELEGRRVSISVGIAIAPNEKISYKKLFENADIALYDAKERGRDCFSVYDKAISDRSNKDKPKEKPAAGSGFSANSKNFSNEIAKDVEYHIFNLLYKNDNMMIAVQKALKFICSSFDVSRAYIYELSSDKYYFAKTFEDYSDPKYQLKSMFKKVPFYEEKSGFKYIDLFKDKDIFYCCDTNNIEVQYDEYFKYADSKSLLQVAFYKNGEIEGFIGIDDCINKRLWIQSELNAFVFVSKVIGSFICNFIGR